VPDRTALVTGGGSGIGRAVAISHFCKGYRLALAGRRIEPLHETARQVAGVPVIQGDHCHEDDAERMISETVAKFRRLNVLVNNAGAIRRNGPGSRDRRAALGWAGAKRPGPFLVARAAIRAMLPPGPADRAIGRSGDRQRLPPRWHIRRLRGLRHTARHRPGCSSSPGRSRWSRADGHSLQRGPPARRGHAAGPRRPTELGGTPTPPDHAALDAPDRYARGCRGGDHLPRLTTRILVTGTVLDVDSGVLRVMTNRRKPCRRQVVVGWCSLRLGRWHTNGPGEQMADGPTR
jgi:NAD(P)-dependent dehydrogenase (short-subunit alcohol dehydrogenase family)